MICVLYHRKVQKNTFL